MKTVTREKPASAALVPPGDWSAVGARGHAVQFYPTDGHLLDLLTRFIGTALVTGEVGIVMATKDHRDGLAKRLKSRGLDVAVAHRQGRYVSLDAAATVRKLTRGGRPDPALFRDVVGGMMSKLVARSERRRIAVFGELAMLLWATGKPEAAIQLEEMWNALALELDFCLCCAYPMSGFGNRHAAPFMKICAQHSHVFTIAQAAALADAVC